VSLHPPAAVPTTVYVVVEPGLAVTLAPVVALRPAPGLHVYVAAPLAVNPTLLPEHNEELGGVTVTVGVGNTLIVMVAVLLHPLLFVPVTVYVVVPAGLAIT